MKYQELFYQHFLTRLKQSRALSTEELLEVGQGQIILGEQAKKMLLIDEIGGFYDTIQDLSMALNLSDPDLVFYRVTPQYRIVKSGASFFD
jgi:protease-4